MFPINMLWLKILLQQTLRSEKLEKETYFKGKADRRTHGHVKQQISQILCKKFNKNVA